MSYAKLMHGDCLKAMRRIDDHSVDLIIADLPYGVTKNAWDKLIPFEPLWTEYRRIAKANAAIVLTATQPFATDVIMSNRAMFKYDWVWPKPPVSPLNAKKRPMPAHEHILVFYTKQPTYNPQGVRGLNTVKRRGAEQFSRSDNYGKTGQRPYIQNMSGYPTSVIRGLKNMLQSDKVHPTQKPIELMEYLVRTYSNHGDVVMDNVMGSGTTGLAAIRLGRNFIGIEKSAEYFEAAAKRITQHASGASWLEGNDKCKVSISGIRSKINSPPQSAKVRKPANHRRPNSSPQSSQMSA